MYVCMYACMYVALVFWAIYLFILRYVYVCMHVCMHVCSSRLLGHLPLHPQVCMHACTPAHPYLRAYVPTCLRAYIHTYIHTYMHACIHTYIHIASPSSPSSDSSATTSRPPAAARSTWSARARAPCTPPNRPHMHTRVHTGQRGQSAVYASMHACPCVYMHAQVRLPVGRADRAAPRAAAADGVLRRIWAARRAQGVCVAAAHGQGKSVSK